MITLIIIALTCLVSISAFSNHSLFSKFLFNAHTIHSNREWYRFISHAFIHADWIHLAMNMYVLYMFGNMVETIFQSAFGTVRGETYFALLYSIGIIASSLPSYNKNKDNYHYNAVGASGAVSAVVFSSISFLMSIPIPMKNPKELPVEMAISGITYSALVLIA